MNNNDHLKLSWVSAQLEKEEATLARLRDGVSKSGEMRRQATVILDSFESRLNRLEQRTNTFLINERRLETEQTNAKKVLVRIDDIVRHYKVANDVESVIYLTDVSENLDFYIEFMERVKCAIAYFNEERVDAHLLSSVRDAFQSGTDVLIQQFDKLTQQTVGNLSEAQIFSALDEDYQVKEGSLNASDVISDDEVVAQLNRVANWLLEHTEETDFIELYALQREADMMRILTMIHDPTNPEPVRKRSPTTQTFRQSPSGSKLIRKRSNVANLQLRPNRKMSSIASITITPPTPGNSLGAPADAHRKVSVFTMGGSSDADGLLRPRSPPRKRTPMAAFRRKMSSALPPILDQLENRAAEAFRSVVPGGVERRISGGAKNFDRLDAVPFLKLLGSYKAMFQVELELFNTIARHKGEQQLTQVLTNRPLKWVLEKGESLSALASTRLHKNDHTVLYDVLPVAKYYIIEKRSKYEFSKVCGGEASAKIDAMLASLISLIIGGISLATTCVKEDGDKFLPADGALHPLTCSTAVLLEQLFDSWQCLDELVKLTKETKFKAMKVLFGEMKPVQRSVDELVNDLFYNLRTKAGNYKSTTTAAIFLMNNVCHLRSLFVRMADKHTTTRWMAVCESELTAAKKTYFKSWEDVLDYLRNTSAIKLKPATANTQSMSQTFATLEKSINAVFDSQETLTIVDEIFLDEFRSDVKNHVLSKFTDFYQLVAMLGMSASLFVTPDWLAARIERMFEPGIVRRIAERTFSLSRGVARVNSRPLSP